MARYQSDRDAARTRQIVEGLSRDADRAWAELWLGVDVRLIR